MAKAKGKTFIAAPVTDATVDLADDTGLMFRKKILPVASINYPAKGGKRRIAFDDSYHADLITAFKAKAYDHPTLQLATADNAHNMLPERTAGEIVDLSRETATDTDGPGLYATIKAQSPEHAKLLRENTALGVSAQIREGLERVDGRSFPRAIRHVLATLDPRVTGLGTFRAVSLSDEDTGKVIDLSGADYEEIDMGKRTDTATDTFDLSDEEIDAALLEAAEAFGDGIDLADDDEPAGGGARKPRVDRAGFISLAAERDELRSEVSTTRVELAKERWLRERSAYSGLGVPKSFLDLAEELLETPGEGVLDLANEDGDVQVDAKQVVRSMLDLLKGVIDLSAVDGYGDEPGAPSADDEAEKDKALSESWDSISGPVS